MRIAIVIAAALLASAPVRADRVPNRARSLADRGRAAHDARDYGRAIAAFTEAYALAPAPGLLFNLAQAYRLRGSCDDASLMYRRFLATGPDDAARALAELHLSAVERCVAQRGTPRTVTAAHAPPRAARADARLIGRDLAPTRASRAEKVGAGLAIGGGAALLIAGYYALESHQASSEVERRYAAGEKWRDLAARAAEGEEAGTKATLAAGLGGVAVLAGAAVLVIDHRRSRSALRVEPIPGGGRVGMAWRF